MVSVNSWSSCTVTGIWVGINWLKLDKHSKWSVVLMQFRGSLDSIIGPRCSLPKSMASIWRFIVLNSPFSDTRDDHHQRKITNRSQNLSRLSLSTENSCKSWGWTSDRIYNTCINITANFTTGIINTRWIDIWVLYIYIQVYLWNHRIWLRLMVILLWDIYSIFVCYSTGCWARLEKFAGMNPVWITVALTWSSTLAMAAREISSGFIINKYNFYQLRIWK